MPERLVVAVLGNRNSGKALTWESLFGKAVGTSRTQNLHPGYLANAPHVPMVMSSTTLRSAENPAP